MLRKPRRFRVAGGSRPDEAPEVPSELRLIVKPNQRREIGRAHALAEELLCTRDAKVGQIGVRWHPDLGMERSAEV